MCVCVCVGLKKRLQLFYIKFFPVLNIFSLVVRFVSSTRRTGMEAGRGSARCSHSWIVPESTMFPQKCGIWLECGSYGDIKSYGNIELWGIIYTFSLEQQKTESWSTPQHPKKRRRRRRRGERERESQSNKWKATELCRIMTAQHVEFLE